MRRSLGLRWMSLLVLVKTRMSRAEEEEEFRLVLLTACFAVALECRFVYRSLC